MYKLYSYIYTVKALNEYSGIGFSTAVEYSELAWMTFPWEGKASRYPALWRTQGGEGQHGVVTGWARLEAENLETTIRGSKYWLTEDGNVPVIIAAAVYSTSNGWDHGYWTAAWHCLQCMSSDN